MATTTEKAQELQRRTLRDHLNAGGTIQYLQEAVIDHDAEVEITLNMLFSDLPGAAWRNHLTTADCQTIINEEFPNDHLKCRVHHDALFITK